MMTPTRGAVGAVGMGGVRDVVQIQRGTDRRRRLSFDGRNGHRRWREMSRCRGRVVLGDARGVRRSRRERGAEEGGVDNDLPEDVGGDFLVMMFVGGFANFDEAFEEVDAGDADRGRRRV